MNPSINQINDPIQPKPVWTASAKKILEKLNKDQKLAVNNVLSLNKYVYLIQGPPGTGKTKLIVSLICILKVILDSKVKILVTAPSNSAVDIIAKRVIEFYKAVPDLFERLVECGLTPKKPIFVITPYKGQYALLTTLLKPFSDFIKVSTIDAAQGSEAEIVIISAVRSEKMEIDSSEGLVHVDDNKSLGFVADYRRLNVALTRARQGLFVVGNALLLQNNNIWNNFIKMLKDDASENNVSYVCLSDSKNASANKCNNYN
uniref:Regulator of nonsense transcripts 1 homolog n=1 Tax=Dermatophagoides pteronyssinus TaxID=6956 RepID=A0A6P6YBP8_DERPT|nr:regulator of nonsense transcripts 1 homolog [Dermatophagoides pteronyssinus]